MIMKTNNGSLRCTVCNAFSSVPYSKNLTFFLQRRKFSLSVLCAPLAIAFRDSISHGVVRIIFLSGLFCSSSIAMSSHSILCSHCHSLYIAKTSIKIESLIFFRLIFFRDSFIIPQLVTIQIQKAFWQTIWFMLLIFITIVGSTMLLTYLFLINKKKKQIEKIETEKKITELQLNTIRGQIDPHFTFNVINSIASVIYKEDKESAMKMFNKFSNLLRVVITSSAKTYRSIDDEISFVKNYLEIEKFRFKDKFEYSITLDKNVDKYKNIPKMVIQTHVENAIKHGLMHKEKEGKLSVSIKCNDNENIIIIEDNGIGRKKAKHLSKQSTGIGLKIINSYYDLFNKYNKEKIIQEIIDLEDVSDNSSGTKIIIKIPLNFNFKI